MDKSIENWLRSSDYDWKTASALYKSGRYLYVIFMCHLSVEKALKALVNLRTGQIPPKIHDLRVLARLTGMNIPEEYGMLISRLNEVSIPTRYPEDIKRLVKQYNRLVTERYLKETKGLLKWIKKNGKLSE
jgi:HEPN domain-containing protein